jgi:hypothetical protein
MIRSRSFIVSLALIAILLPHYILAQASDRDAKNPPAADWAQTQPQKITGTRSDYSNARVVVNSKNKNLISLNFVDVDICKALSAIAMEREINISTSKDVTGKISLHLYQVTLEEALNAITLAGGFVFKKLGDLYYVYKPSKERELQADRLQMRIFKLKYVDTEKIQDILGSIPGIRLLKIHKPTKPSLSRIIRKTSPKLKKYLTHGIPCPNKC